MPELPEVETSRLGLSPHIVGATLKKAVVRRRDLRWPIPKQIPKAILNKKLLSLSRRGKYLVFDFADGALLMHLGMSGRVQIHTKNTKPEKHSHLDLVFNNNNILRFTDPRRFGAVLWQAKDTVHPLLQHLGVEPLDKAFSSSYFYQACQRKKTNIKAVLMDSHIVVGIGNIYANEALFKAGIKPDTPAYTLTKEQISDLLKASKAILKKAIKQGGTTLKDFSDSAGKPGYFQQYLYVYGRGGEACRKCKSILEAITLNQRQTVFCPSCQS